MKKIFSIILITLLLATIFGSMYSVTAINKIKTNQNEFYYGLQIEVHTNGNFLWPCTIRGKVQRDDGIEDVTDPANYTLELKCKYKLLDKSWSNTATLTTPDFGDGNHTDVKIYGLGFIDVSLRLKNDGSGEIVNNENMHGILLAGIFRETR